MMAAQKQVSFQQAISRRNEWARVRRLSRWNKNRKLRRVLVVVWLCLLAADAKIACAAALRAPVSALYPILALFGLAYWMFRWIDAGLAQPSLEDRAEIEYGEPFEQLKESQRQQVFALQTLEGLLGNAQSDEREAELRLRAEGAAYRWMRPGLAIAVAAYWAVCLLGPFATIRTQLAVTAVAFTSLALLVLVLPTMIRLWTEADPVGEMKAVIRDIDS
jgi:hypothetical protein